MVCRGSQLSEAQSGPCPAEPKVWQRLLRSALDFPDRLAVASLHQASSLHGVGGHFSAEHLRWSYADLLRAVTCFADSLTRAGVRRGMAFATVLDNSAEFILAFWTAHKLGCPFVPLSPRSLASGEELLHMLGVADVALVLVGDTETARKFDAASAGSYKLSLKIIASDDTPDCSWVTLGGLLAREMAAGGQDPKTEPETAKTSQNADELVAVLFTSGTTSLPKGVPHTNTTLNAFCQNLALGGTSPTSVYCPVLPCNHAMGYFYPLHFMMIGAAILYPSPSFNAVAVVEALESASVTHTALVPTALYALLEVIEARGRRPLKSRLLDVSLSGSAISPKNIRQVFTKLGSSGVSTGFGMTEGSPVWTGRTKDPEQLIYGDLSVAGWPSPGARVRICAPGSRQPLPQGTEGEIHQSGPGVIRAYLGKGVGQEHFYQDADGRHWFVTGDQAVMHPDGRLSITGRSKDLIIRGGENIAPAAIEAAVASRLGIQAQVVGVPDSVAGETPVAVVKDLGSVTVKALQDAVLDALGGAFVPSKVVTLRELRLDEFPTTTSTKVQKTKLVELICSLEESSKARGSEGPSDESIEHQVLWAYHKSTGIPIHSLDTETPSSILVDSISMMRTREYLRKNSSLHLTVQDMAAHKTIASQIRLLQQRGASSRPDPPRVAEKLRAPTADEITVPLVGPKAAGPMRERIATALGEKELPGLDSVASIFPAHDYMQVLLRSGLIDTWNFCIAVITDAPSIDTLRAALEKALANHPILTSLYLYDEHGTAHYVTLQPSERLWQLCLVDYGTVRARADVQQLAIEYPFPRHSRAPGPLFQCLLVRLEDTDSAAMVMNVHHLVQDASSLRLFLEDLEQALVDPDGELPQHVEIQAWQESFAAFRHSPAATASVNYHVRRLAGLPQLLGGLYPVARVPRQAITENPDGLDHAVDAPGLVDLRRQFPTISAAVVVKAAMALANVRRTGHTHALFSNFEAGRGEFPFTPQGADAMESLDVNGPVMQGVCNIIQVNRDQSCVDFLHQLQEEQAQLTRHAHAPLLRVLDELNSNGSAAGDAVIEVHRTQFLTWVPGMLGSYEKLLIGQIAIRCAAGLVVVAALAGSTSSTYNLSMRWDVANYSRQQTADYAKDLASAILWLTKRDNWLQPIGSLWN